MTPDERDQLAGHGRCVGCGLCGFAAPRAGYLRAERLPSQLTRSLPTSGSPATSRSTPSTGRRAAAVCPLGVPLEGIRGFVRERLGRDGVEPPRPAPAGAAPG